MRRFLPLIPASFLLLVLLAFVPAAFAGGGCHQGPNAVAGTGKVLNIVECTFVPSMVRVAVGDEITWLNTGQSPHDVRGEQWAWGSPLLEPGDSFSHSFSAPGLYPFSCSLHPGMAGVIEVVAKGSAAVAAGDPSPAAPAPAADQRGATESTPDGAGDLVPVVAGGLGIVLGALGTVLLVRRRAMGVTTAEA